MTDTDDSNWSMYDIQAISLPEAALTYEPYRHHPAKRIAPLPELDIDFGNSGGAEPPLKRFRGPDNCCNICDIEFTEQRSLIRHEKQSKLHHTKAYGVTPPGHKCGKCNKTFVRRHDLRRHEMEIHEGLQVRNYVCERVTYGFGSTAQPTEYNQTRPGGPLSDQSDPELLERQDIDCGKERLNAPTMLTQYPIGLLQQPSLCEQEAAKLIELGPILPCTNTYNKSRPAQQVSGIDSIKPISAKTVEVKDVVDQWLAEAFESLYMNDPIEVKLQVVARNGVQSPKVERCPICHRPHSETVQFAACMLKHHENPGSLHVCPDCKYGFVLEEHLEHHTRCVSSYRHCGFYFSHMEPCSGHHRRPSHPQEVDRSDYQRMHTYYTMQLYMKAVKRAKNLCCNNFDKNPPERWSLDAPPSWQSPRSDPDLPSWRTQWSDQPRLKWSCNNKVVDNAVPAPPPWPKMRASLAYGISLMSKLLPKKMVLFAVDGADNEG